MVFFNTEWFKLKIIALFNNFFIFALMELLICLFLSVIIHEEFNISARIKLLLKVRLSRRMKVIDCFPCFSFWLSVIICLSLDWSWLIPIAVYLIVKVYERIRGN